MLRPLPGYIDKEIAKELLELLVVLCFLLTHPGQSRLFCIRDPQAFRKPRERNGTCQDRSGQFLVALRDDQRFLTPYVVGGASPNRPNIDRGCFGAIALHRLNAPLEMADEGVVTFFVVIQRDEGILDGDYVLVQRASSAKPGQRVIALLPDGESTLKTFFREPDGRIRLQPANPEFSPIIVEDCQIQGVVIGVMRRY